MSSIRKHTCVDESPGSAAAAAVKRVVSRPRCVLSSDVKKKTTGVKVTKSVSTPASAKYTPASTLPPGIRRKKPLLDLRPHSGGDTSDLKKGSQKGSPDNTSNRELKQESYRSQITDQSSKRSTEARGAKSVVQEIYKNNNFKTQPDRGPPSETSIERLVPITENVETVRACCSKTSSAEKCPLLRATRQKLDQETFASTTDRVNDVSTFRKKHFFECHSAEAMLGQRASALRDHDHVCTYKFYLNERLFPTPLYSDIHNNIRCAECSLPMSYPSTAKDKTNATIQAKVTMGSSDQLKDVIITLPATDSLLVMEKNKSVKELLSEDVIHFGILKIDQRRALVGGHVPDNSLALRYQKGYREYTESEDITLSGVTESQIIYV